MKFLDLIRTRQSCRKFRDQPVSRDIIERCLEAARLAPSACNSQPWTFIVLDNKEKIREFSEQIMGGIYSINKDARTAGALVFVVRERSKWYAILGGLMQDTPYNLIDIGIACEHLILQATEEGVGSWWMGWFNEKKLRKLLGISRTKKIDIIIGLGYSEDDTSRKKDRKSLEEIRRYVE